VTEDNSTLGVQFNSLLFKLSSAKK